MLGESSILLGTIVGSSLVGVLLGWTGVVYWSGRRSWRRLDPLLLGLLIEGCLRQGSVASRSGLRLFRPAPELACSTVLWAASAIHCLQAATLATLALSAPLLRRRPRLFTRSHLSYHLVSTALLASCIGLAAVLSRPDACLPDIADPRYTLFSLALHTSLVLLCLLGLCLNCCSSPGGELLGGSTSDLSSAVSDISRHSNEPLRARHYLVAELLMRAKLHETDPTYMSTTSSTNSRACLAKPRPPEHIPPITSVAVVLIGLAANHIPVLVVGMSEAVWSTVWRVDEVPEWGAVLEGLLLPLVLALCDRAFLDRVATVYTRASPYDMPRPTQGLYGKFRRFGGSMMQQHQEPQPVRFPITNGSLFTTLEGRGCLIRQHNYRRVPPPVGMLGHHMVGLGGQMHHHLGGHLMNGAQPQQPMPQQVGQLPKPHHGPRPPTMVSSVEQLRALLGGGSLGGGGGLEESDETALYATLSSVRSACSATTSANDDFEFFHHEIKQQSGNERELVKKRSTEDLDKAVMIEDDEEMSKVGGSLRGWRRMEGPPPGRLVPVLSVDSLAAVLTRPGLSYLDTGDICTHNKCDSVPDLKRIFLTDYL